MRCVWALLSVLLLATCGDERGGSSNSPEHAPSSQREVVAYVSTDEAIARPILAAFAAETGIAVRARYDSENSKSTALAAMLRTEMDAPRADVFWCGDSIAVTMLGRQEVLSSWRSQRSDRFPDWLRGEAGRWVGFAPRVRVLVYDPQRVTQSQLPESMMDFAREGWNLRTGIADPRFGTTRGHVGALAALLDGNESGAFARWARRFIEQGGRIISGGNAAVVDGVLRGEYELGLTDSDDFYAALQGGARLAAIPIRQLPASVADAGAMLIPNSVSLVHGAPHPYEANELMQYLLSGKVSRWLHESRSGNLLVPEVEALSPGESMGAAVPEGLPLLSDEVAKYRIDHVPDRFLYEDALVADVVDAAVDVLRSEHARQVAE